MLLPESSADVLHEGGGRAPDHTLDDVMKRIGGQAEVRRQGGSSSFRGEHLTRH